MSRLVNRLLRARRKSGNPLHPLHPLHLSPNPL